MWGFAHPTIIAVWLVTSARKEIKSYALLAATITVPGAAGYLYSRSLRRR